MEEFIWEKINESKSIMLKELNKDFKETAIGLIPEDWEVKKLREVSKNRNSSLSINNLLDNNGKYVLYGAGGFLKRIDFYEEDEKYISIIKDGAGVGRVFLCDEFSSILGTMSYIKPINNNISLHYLYFLYQTINFEKYITGSTIPHIYFSSYSLKKIPLPPLPEQQKIAEILTAWDIAINTSKLALEELIKQKKWLAYNLLFNRNADNLLPLSKLLIRVKNSFTPDPQKYYKQIGIRSHTKGIFYKEEVSGLSLGNKSVFHIEPDCFILNIVFAWEHAIAKTTLNEVGMIASHRFPMFKPVTDKLDLDYLLHFFKSQKGKDLLGLASPGGAGRNKTLGQSEFLKLKIPVPNIEEQKIIAEVLDKADEEILLYKEKITNLQLQKKGLMQQLLTGKVRVKI